MEKFHDRSREHGATVEERNIDEKPDGETGSRKHSQPLPDAGPTFDEIRAKGNQGGPEEEGKEKKS